MSTPVASSLPVSKISASSMSRPRLPVKVVGAARATSTARVARPCLFSMFIGPWSLSRLDLSRQNSGERCGVGGAVALAIRLGAGDDDEVVESGLGQEARDRNAADLALLRPRLDALGSRARRAKR